VRDYLQDFTVSTTESLTHHLRIVAITFAKEQSDPKDPTKTDTTTWFDMFRIENGKLAEHRNCMQKI